MMDGEGRILVHFSCGAASAVAWKIAQERYGNEAVVEAIYCASVENDEHQDNQRFLADVERWVGKPVTKLYHPKFRSIDAVFTASGFIGNRFGAICTRTLKREVGDAYSRPEDRNVLGYTADESLRIRNFVERNPSLNCLWVLAVGGVTKSDCYKVLQAEGIELPVMYRLGYGHNNCIGCVKGGKGYWNKIRRDFPEIFAKRAEVQRAIGPGACFRSGGTGFMLDQLDPDEGRDEVEQDIECGMFCSEYHDIIGSAVAELRRQPVAPASASAANEQEQRP